MVFRVLLILLVERHLRLFLWGFSLSRLDVNLATLEVSLVKLSEGRYGRLCCGKANETNAERYAFTVFSERNLDIDNLAMLAKEILKFFLRYLVR